jgi:hypothetical protein
MNQITYRLARSRRDDLLRQAAGWRRAEQLRTRPKGVITRLRSSRNAQSPTRLDPPHAERRLIKHLNPRGQAR